MTKQEYAKLLSWTLFTAGVFGLAIYDNGWLRGTLVGCLVFGGISIATRAATIIGRWMDAPTRRP